MAIRHRALVAAQPAAYSVLRTLLAEVIDLVPAHTTVDAFGTLQREGRAIDLIIATVAFDGSLMIEFLEAVKSDPKLKRIPFLCTRVLPGVLSDRLVGNMRDACKECGAVDLLDLARLPADRAQSAVRSAVMSYVEPSSA